MHLNLKAKEHKCITMLLNGLSKDLALLKLMRQPHFQWKLKINFTQ